MSRFEFTVLLADDFAEGDDLGSEPGNVDPDHGDVFFRFEAFGEDGYEVFNGFADELRGFFLPRMSLMSR